MFDATYKSEDIVCHLCTSDKLACNAIDNICNNCLVEGSVKGSKK